MDNVCHTLMGAACAEAGLKRRTRFSVATLLIASNLPDADVFVFFTDTSSVSFRRGWTHGVLAQLLLPLALTAVMIGIGRLWPRNEGPPVSGRWLLLVSYIGVSLHVFLDFLNNYGIRLLAPFDWRWFYGDAVFIIDVWLWLVLGAGVWLARRRRASRPAQGALVFAACYVVLMLVSARAAREIVFDTWRDLRGTTPQALMVGPVPASPFTRDVIVDADDHYELGTFSWRWPPTVTFDSMKIPKNSSAREVAVARDAPNIHGFLSWSRFPYWEIERASGGARVSVRDVRFSRPIRAGFVASTIVPAE